MAGKILQGVIQVLDRLYNFPGGTRGLTEFDLASPILPVHDVGRMAEFGARGQRDSGYLFITQILTNDTGGALTLFFSTNIYGALDGNPGIDFRTADHRLWIIQVAGNVANTNATNFTRGLTALNIPTDKVFSLSNYMTDSLSPISSGGFRPMLSDSDTESKPELPIFVPLQSFWQGNVVWTNDNIVRYELMLWAGPIGVTPPGLS